MQRNKRRLRAFSLALGCVAVILPSALGQDRSQGRSMVISRGGIVAAESPLAAQAGVRILESGGNAVDAAIAADAIMDLVEPMVKGLGGGLFAFLYDGEAYEGYGLKSSRWAPKR